MSDQVPIINNHAGGRTGSVFGHLDIGHPLSIGAWSLVYCSHLDYPARNGWNPQPSEGIVTSDHHRPPEEPSVPERDYVLGTHDEEIERLGLQHRVWRPRMLEAWRRAGVTVGSRVIDIGAGPGYAYRWRLCLLSR